MNDPSDAIEASSGRVASPHEPRLTSPVIGTKYRSWAWPVLVLLATVGIWLAVRSSLPPETFYSGDGGSKVMQARSWVQTGRWEVSWGEQPTWVESLWERHQAFPVGEPFVYEVEGRRLGVYGPLVVAVFAVFDTFVGPSGWRLPSLMALLVTLLALAGILRRTGVEDSLAWGAAAAAVFGTPLFVYGLLAWEHAWAVAAVASAAWWVAIPGRPLRHGLVAGLSLGLAMAWRPESAGAAGAIVLATLLGWWGDPKEASRGRWVRVVMVVGGAALVVVPIAVFQQTLSGSWTGVHGLEALAGGTSVWWLRRAETIRLVFVLVVMAPWIALGVLPPSPRQRRAWRTAWLVAMGAILSGVLLAPHVGGKQWGPRFLLATYPFAALAVAWSLAGLRSRTHRSLAWVIVVLWSMMLTWWGIDHVRLAAQRFAPVVERLTGESEPADAVLVGSSFTAQEAMSALYGQPVARVNDGATLNRVLSELSQQGELTVDWIDYPPYDFVLGPLPYQIQGWPSIPGVRVRASPPERLGAVVYLRLAIEKD